MLHTRALYNLLRLNALEDPTVGVEKWAIEDLRALSFEELFSRLKDQGIQVDRKSFIEFSRDCDTPEELSDILLPDEAEEKGRDSLYLVVFELWRRLLPEKQSLSIFFDEMDHRISQYDQGNMDSDEPIQDTLANLLEILDQNVDSGADPGEIFSAISEYCAHDLESFFYDYIADLLDSENSLYASELIEEFSPYVSDPLWFDFLRIRLISITDIGEANLAMHRLLEHELDLPFLFEILRFLSANGEHALFKIGARKGLPLIATKEELIEIMTLIADFYRRLDEDEKEKMAQQILSECTSDHLQPSDIDKLHQLITE